MSDDWMPEMCGGGHPIGPGTVNWSWVFCDCPAATGGGHHVAYCRLNGCHQPTWPPEHTGPRRAQR